eukprot:gene15359-17178_t
MNDLLDDDSDDEMLLNRRTKKRKIACALGISLITQSYQIEGRRGNINRPREYVVDKIKFIAETNPMRFKKMYRLSVEDFNSLLEKIRPMLVRSKKRGDAIDPIVKLCVSLRFLAGAIFHDLAFGYELPENCICSYVWETLDAIDSVINNINFPMDNLDELRELETEFNELSNNLFIGTIAAADGVVFKMEKPRSEEVNGDVISFYNRKGYFAYGMQAFVSAKCKFLSISSRVCSSSHDSTSYAVSEVSKAIEEGKLPPEFHIVMDEAYPCRGQILSPFKGRNLPADKDAFNYFLSLNRQVVERAFGILVARWGIFWRPLRVSVKRIPLILSVCCKLHNICVDRFGESLEGLPPHNNAQDPSEIRVLLIDQTGTYAGYRSDLEKNDRRDFLCSRLVSLGAKRPERSVIRRSQRI